MTEQNKKKITEMCLAGACNRGIVYIGAFKKFEEENILDLQKVVAVSIGSFIILCFIIGYSANEMFKEIVETDIGSFKDITFSEPASVLKGETFRVWISNVISKKVSSDITFLELYEKTKVDFTVISVCVYAGSDAFKEGIVHLNYKTAPDMPVVLAINSSMTVPLVFPPIIYKDCHFIDGGVLENFPITSLSLNAVGLITDYKQDTSISTRNPIVLLNKILDLISKRMQELKNIQNKNIIFVKCTDFDFLNLDMTIDDKITLFRRGYDAAGEFIDNRFYSSSEETDSILVKEE